jgi:hypothetical protein
MKPLSTIKQFAKQRERAYLATCMLSGIRRKALARIYKLCDYWQQLNEEQQYKIVKQLSADIEVLLPAEGSRFQQLRNNILRLLNN